MGVCVGGVSSIGKIKGQRTIKYRWGLLWEQLHEICSLDRLPAPASFLVGPKLFPSSCGAEHHLGPDSFKAVGMSWFSGWHASIAGVCVCRCFFLYFPTLTPLSFYSRNSGSWWRPGQDISPLILPPNFGVFAECCFMDPQSQPQQLL